MKTALQLVSALVLCVTSAEAFTANSSFGLTRASATGRSSATPFVLSATSALVDKYYQLEEMEDREDCTTEIYLADDGSITVGETDGPKHKSAGGSWKFSETEGTDAFSMVIERTYDAGLPSKNPTDVGDFKFTVQRKFSGSVSLVGECVAITGKMLANVEAAGVDSEVGFFNLIDTTEERKVDFGKKSLSS